MNTQEKIKKANELNEAIEKIKDFINLAKSAQIIDKKNEENNELNGINKFIGCTISAYISTGSQSPRYERTMVGNEVIVSLMTSGLVGVEEKLKEKEEELKRLFN